MTADDTARDFSLYDPEIMRDPHRVYDELRAKCPVSHSERDEGFWMATRYADVVEATKDPATYSSRYIMIPRLKFGPDFVERPPITLDPPRHTFFRRLLQPGFTHVQAQKWEPTIRKVCRDALAPLLAAGRCNVVTDYSKKIPLGFTCELMGVPPEMERSSPDGAATSSSPPRWTVCSEPPERSPSSSPSRSRPAARTRPTTSSLS
ncbi:MAG: cytochrome P450 [Acidimicrobiales bacterium]|nr:cytochrome P450 [Acidimicrobiales bacterium]